MTNYHTRISKYLSYILRHNPDEIGVEMDEAGWVSVQRLIEASDNHGRNINRKVIEETVKHSDKKRFSFSSDGKYIRANYGHSVNINPDYQPEEPPATLFHGTADRFIFIIRQEGLHSQNRQFVHLSSDRTSAIEVGKRHGKPVILVIAAGKMHKDDHLFYQSDAGIWLTKMVPATYITFPDSTNFSP